MVPTHVSRNLDHDDLVFRAQDNAVVMLSPPGGLHNDLFSLWMLNSRRQPNLVPISINTSGVDYTDQER